MIVTYIETHGFRKDMTPWKNYRVIEKTSHVGFPAGEGASCGPAANFYKIKDDAGDIVEVNTEYFKIINEYDLLYTLFASLIDFEIPRAKICAQVFSIKSLVNYALKNLKWGEYYAQKAAMFLKEQINFEEYLGARAKYIKKTS